MVSVPAIQRCVLWLQPQASKLSSHRRGTSLRLKTLVIPILRPDPCPCDREISMDDAGYIHSIAERFLSLSSSPPVIPTLTMITLSS